MAPGPCFFQGWGLLMVFGANKVLEARDGQAEAISMPRKIANIAEYKYKPYFYLTELKISDSIQPVITLY